MPKQKKNRICPVCGKPLYGEHPNRKYHPGACEATATEMSKIRHDLNRAINKIDAILGNR